MVINCYLEVEEIDTLKEILDRIARENMNIDLTVEDLDGKLDHVLEKNEKDFLTAYRYHMLKV